MMLIGYQHMAVRCGFTQRMRKASAGKNSLRSHNLLAEERRAGLDDISSYSNFSEQVNKTKLDLLRFLIDVKRAGKKIVGYGAPAKGNTLLNFCGIRTRLSRLHS